MSEQEAVDLRSDVRASEAAQNYGDDGTSHNSDDEPMVYQTPRDYATWARRERDRRIAEGADADSVILQSEVINHVPRREGESDAEFVKRYSDTMNSMIRRGVAILNDQCVADVVPDGFSTADGREFYLGPGSGATKGEYQGFIEWFDAEWDGGPRVDVPERFAKFEKPAERKSDL